ncbi:non-ribosomal peptide synthetase [Streptomyces profundus]|uniref:non-ribosomal peptide synthetase n=1 Tax=Streptomyces profundus TaxID=2867410 RepID=UPI001D166BE9|nr:non-ribosomal peptide synthetase [Streptomyces sp. MA3_2.13]UED88035.1 amino acid adenylation domain-containing protein [Streptomyces sp. MA3_2.13]
MSDAGIFGLDNGAAHRVPTRKSELLSLVADLLDENPEDVDEQENLIEYGIDSISVMRMVSLWNRQGLDVTVGELFEAPTIAEWWEILSGRVVAEPEPAGEASADADPGTPFALVPVQHAYWVGRGDGQVLGGVGCHVYLEIDGSGVDADRLHRAVLAVADRHPMLRARFLDDGTQRIMPEPGWNGLTRYDLRGSDEAAVERELVEIRERLSHRRLAVEHGEVFDIRLSLLPDGRTRMHVELDLLVADVLSFNIFLDDLAALYTGGAAALPPLTYVFPRYRADLERSRRAAFARDRDYWRSRLAELPPAPRLPLAQDPARIGKPVFRRLAHWLDPERHARLVTLARRHQVTPAMVLGTAYAEILGRWSGQSRLLLNLPLFDRVALHDDVGGMIADFTNLVLLDVDLSGDSFIERVRGVQRRFQTDISHSAYSGVEVLRDISRHGDLDGGTAPVVFASNLGGGDLLSDRCRSSFGEFGYSITQTPQVWLDHQLMDMDGGLYLNWDFVEGLFPEGVVEGMFGAYREVLDWLAEGDWNQPTPIALPAEQRAVRERVNATQAPESGRLLHEGFFHQATTAPHRTALLWDDNGHLTYRQLADHALHIAGELTAHGVKPHDTVAITLPKGPDQIAAILATLATGATYVPIGIDQPPPRRNRILTTANIHHAITTTTDWPTHLHTINPHHLTAPPLPHPHTNHPDDSAYIIFTSGSTGQPKGVEVSHRAATNTIDDINQRFHIQPTDRVLALSAADFDLSVYDTFGLLTAGAALVLTNENDRREAQRWLHLTQHHHITIWNSVPALFDMYLTVAQARHHTDHLRLILLSGDWINLDLPTRYHQRNPHGHFIALGGATEAAIWSNAQPVTHTPPHWTSIPYGQPLRNQHYRVVDTQGRDCPDWVPGELWIGGTGLAKGYRGDPTKTATKFTHHNNQRWYHTGDLGRYWPDGTLEFLGRTDHQIKIRGFRIELGEIETILETHPHINHAITTTHQEKIVATITTDSPEETADQDALRAWVAQRLPEHMVPERFAVRAELPLTANGKVDRARVIDELRTEGEEATTTAGDPPRGPIEEVLAGIWAELLSLRAVHRADNFFHRGGDSLIGTRMIAALISAGVAGGELRLLFANPVLADFAALLRLDDAQAAFGPVQADEAARHLPFPASEVQRAYWIGRRPEFTLGGVGCHFYTEFDGVDVDPERLERAWNILIDRHEILRAVFDAQGAQRIQPAVPRFTIPVEEADAEHAEEALDRLRETMSHRVFDPAVWPLFDVRAVRHPGGVRLGVGLDNLILDALSVLILLTELEQLYRDPEARLRPVGVSFRDYQLNAGPSQRELDRARAYWLERLEDLPPPPQLPLAIDPARIERPRFARRERWLDSDRWARITERARGHELTPSALLLACYAEVLGAWSARPDMTLVLTTFQRRDVHQDINNILGDFTSLLLVSYRPKTGAGLLANARALQEQMWQDLDHQALPATWVLREMARRAGTAEVSMPTVFTSALGIIEDLPGLGSEKFAEIGWGISQTPQVWLDHQVREYPHGVYLNWDFVEGLFPEGVVEGMFGAYREVLDWLAEGDWNQPTPIALPAEQRAVRERVNATQAPESGRLLHEGFFHQATTAPHRTALLWDDNGHLTYRQLADHALHIAGELTAHGVKPHDTVAITLPKGPDQIAAILATLATGATYVPIGIDQPPPRRNRILTTANIHHAITTTTDWPTHLHTINPHHLTAPPLPHPHTNHPDDSAYIIFTSGSTGQPKGVEVSHRAATNTIDDINQRFHIQPTDRVLALSAADFDLSVYDTFGLLTAGAALVLTNENDRREAQRWLHLTQHHHITIWNSVPALFDMYLTVAQARHHTDHLRLILLSGDWINLDLPTRYHQRNPHGHFIALGGATEAAIWSNAQPVTHTPPHWTSIPYGQPLRNQHYRVVDTQGRDCPDWVPGELWIGGTGLAKGYRGDPTKTATKFTHHNNQRWYHTGDLGRYWPDGTLEFLGRTDHQIKIRGFRIELGEIETILETHPHINHAITTTHTANNQQKIIATITTEPEGGTVRSSGMAALAPKVEVAPGPADGSGAHAANLIESWTAGLVRAGIGDAAAAFDEVAGALGTAEESRGVLRLWLDWLADREVLAGEEGTYAAGPRWREVLDQRTWETRRDRAVGTPAGLLADRLVAVTDTVAGILRGERDPLVLLEDPVLAPEAAVVNQSDSEGALRGAAATVAALAAELGRPVRVAELGCRSGVAARRLLARLAAEDIELTLLDDAPSLLETAEKRLADLPHTIAYRLVRDGILPPELRHTHDVVLANHSLHRHADPVTGVGLARQLLVPGGVLIGLEHRELAPIGLLTAGLLERGLTPWGGRPSRSGGPLLDGAGWAEVLDRGGLREVSVAEGEDSSLMVLVARAAPDLPVVREAEVIARAREQLPPHMVPERVTVLPALPLSANGKVDRARVAALLAEQPDPGDGGEPPRTAMEETVSRMWSELLRVPEVGRAHNFFALGGDSLTATHFAETIRARFGVELPLRQMFQDPTVAAVAASIDASLEAAGATDGSTEDGIL